MEIAPSGKVVTRVGLVAGPLIAAMILALPLELPPPAHRLLAVLAWTLAWWISEAIPMAVTSIFAAVLLVATGITDARSALAPFADPVIFLFLGGFVLARGLELHGTDRRIALRLMTLPGVRGRPRRGVIALIAATAFLSMWISNTAATVIALPIALGTIDRLLPGKTERHANFLLAIAWAASIGGVATPVGTPPNAITLGLLERMTGARIGFVQWMTYGLPVAIALTAVVCLLVHRDLGRHLPARTEDDPALRALAALGPATRAQRSTLLAAGAAVALWMVPDVLGLVLGADFGPAAWVKRHIPESMAALLAASLLFVLPGERGKPVLDWREAARIDWGTLLLFGGGLALGTQILATGLSESLGRWMPGGGASLLALTGLAALAIFLTEILSNTAAANLLVPLVIAAAGSRADTALGPALAVGIACSLGFMMPMGTPPNAIVYATGRVPLSLMLRRGWVLNLISIVVIVLLLRALGA